MQSSWRRGIAAVALVVLAGSVGYPPALAHGNGRYPAGRFVVVGPGVHGALIALQATFGVVLSSDGGRTWRWLCEESLGFSGTFDPALAFTRGGTLGVGLPDGLSLSNRSQCSFSRPATAPRTQVIDLAVDPLGDTMLAAFTPLGGRNAIGISNDQGLTWRTTELPADVRIDTLDVVPGHPERIYVSGSHMGVPLLMRSDDGGGSFVETTRSFLGGFDAYITAVDGAQPDVVYVRTNLPSGATTLARSTDRGVTLRPLVQTSTLMVGATVAADGRRMWASSSRLSDGLLRSSDGGSTWENLPLSFLPLCLRHHAGILFACADQATYGFALACSTDGGEHFAPLLAFEDVAGPEACPAGSTVREQCDPRWSALRSMLRADSGVPSPPRMYHDADLGDPAELPDVPKDDALPHLDAGHDSGLCATRTLRTAQAATRASWTLAPMRARCRGDRARVAARLRRGVHAAGLPDGHCSPWRWCDDADPVAATTGNGQRLGGDPVRVIASHPAGSAPRANGERSHACGSNRAA